MTKKIITLTINEKDVSFEPNITAYNGMINDMTMDNKVAPLTTYLKRIVTAESKEYLDELLSFPGGCRTACRSSKQRIRAKAGN